MPTMKNFILCLILGLFVIPSVARPIPAQAADSNQNIFRTTITFGVQSEDDLTAFVVRFYRECLDREPDLVGLGAWVEQLQAGTKSGSDVAKGFIKSPEFINRNLDDRDYMYVLYNAFFNRDPDDAGLTGWLNALNSGSTRGRRPQRLHQFGRVCRTVPQLRHQTTAHLAGAAHQQRHPGPAVAGRPLGPGYADNLILGPG